MAILAATPALGGIKAIRKSLKCLPVLAVAAGTLGLTVYECHWAVEKFSVQQID